jgi:hypothetical protein
VLDGDLRIRRAGGAQRVRHAVRSAQWSTDGPARGCGDRQRKGTDSPDHPRQHAAPGQLPGVHVGQFAVRIRDPPR